MYQKLITKNLKIIVLVITIIRFNRADIIILTVNGIKIFRSTGVHTNLATSLNHMNLVYMKCF